MAQTTSGGRLSSVYERRIGPATNANEVTGYWVFFAGVVVGILGLVVYFATAPATMGRGFAYALAALAPAFLMVGAVLRFPLRRMATYLAGAGLAITFVAVAWFLMVFPGGWSTATGHTGVIVTYIVGLVFIGVGGGIVPLATDPRDAAAERTARDVEAADREKDLATLAREEGLLADIAGLEGDNADLKTSKAEFELYKDTDAKWRWRLVHDNGNIIADSGESYSSKANAQKGLGSVKLNALGAEIIES